MPKNPRLVRAQRGVERRLFLKAVGLGLSVPFALHLTKMATAAPDRPKRLLIYYFPHGVPNEHLDMQPYLTAGGDFADFGVDPTMGVSKPDVHVNPDYTFETRSGLNLLSPLEPYRNMLHVVRGLYQAGKFGTHDSIGAILTGDGVGPSVDRLVAQELGMNSLFLGAVPNINDSLDSTNGVLVRDTADWVAPERDVVATYDRIFGGIQAEPEPTVDLSPEFRTEALNLTIEEVSELRTTVAGLTQADSKLAAHLAALENIKSTSTGLGDAMSDACITAPSIPHIEDLRGADVGKQEWEPRYYLEPGYFEEISEAQAEIAAYSLLCGHTQVATLQNMYASADYPVPSALPNRPTDSHHIQVSHVNYTPTDLQGGMRVDYANAQMWFMQRVARICEILDQPDPFDAEHTALENTLIYVTSEIADGNLHGKELSRMWISGDVNTDIFQYYPAFILGGGAGSLAPGSLITVDNRPIADLLLTLAKAMGSSATSFGTSGTQPFSELLA